MTVFLVTRDFNILKRNSLSQLRDAILSGTLNNCRSSWQFCISVRSRDLLTALSIAPLTDAGSVRHEIRAARPWKGATLLSRREGAFGENSDENARKSTRGQGPRKRSEVDYEVASEGSSTIYIAQKSVHVLYFHGFFLDTSALDKEFFPVIQTFVGDRPVSSTSWMKSSNVAESIEVMVFQILEYP